ncbi:MAG: two-component regulator propeller domain-containing protein, partial [Candidatus Kapaibacteriota bacterium]
MRTTIHAILLAFVLPFCQEVVAQIPQTHSPRKPVPQVSLTQFIHRKWETEQGLPQNSAISITQTRDGYVWFGTTDGLVRF